MNTISIQDASQQIWDLVVIGKGYSGIANVITRKHNSDLPSNCLWVSMNDDPWGDYVNHQMGQFPSMLAIPGFENAKLKETDQNDFLYSSVFHQQNLKHLEYIRNQTNINEIIGTIDAKIEKQDDESYVIQITTPSDGKMSLNCQRIDLCTGPGPDRKFSTDPEILKSGPWTRKPKFDTTLTMELRNKTNGRCTTGQQFLMASPEASSIVVAGSGPLTAGCIEHALNSSADNVVWIAKQGSFISSFPLSKRYDGLIQDADRLRAYFRSTEKNLLAIPFTDIIFDNDRDQLFQYISPKDSRLSICFGLIQECKANSIVMENYSCSRVNNLHGITTYKNEIEFDKLIISASSETSFAEQRSIANITRNVAPYSPGRKSGSYFEPIIRQGMVVGVKSNDNRLRILGAPSRNSALLNGMDIDYRSELRNYKQWHDSLCPQARMGFETMGITVGATVVALANNFYSTISPDLNANTVQIEQEDIVETRRLNHVPFTKDNIPDGYSEVYPPEISL